MPQTIHCSLSYHDLKIETVPVFANGVSQGVYGNPTVFDPKGAVPIPYSESDFNNLINAEETAYSTYKKGGIAQKPAFNIARAALMKGLDDTAEYVDKIAKGDANIIILGGYEPTGGVGGATAKMSKACLVLK